MSRTFHLFAGLSAGLIISGSSLADFPIAASFDLPTFDRWNYPFNPTPGSRANASTFGSFTDPGFDNRDAQFYIAFDTSDQVPTGLPPFLYDIQSVTVTIQTENSAEVFYDPTLDPWTAFIDPKDPQYVEDADPGQPFEIWGVGFRYGFNAFAFGETGPYVPGDPIGQNIKTAHAASFDGEGMLIDVSTSVVEQFDPVPWAIGTVDGLTPGDVVPQDSTVTFELNVDDPAIREYLQVSLTQGLLPLMVTSLNFVEPMAGDFPSYYTKENLAVKLGLANGAQLAVDVIIVDEPFPEPEDLNNDGVVDAADLALLLAAWGDCGGCPEDLDMDGFVDAADLALLLAAWG